MYSLFLQIIMLMILILQGRSIKRRNIPSTPQPKSQMIFLKKAVQKIIRILPIAVCIIAALLYLLSGREISFEQIVNYAPEKPFFAALFIIALYAVKSLTVFFPVAVLNIAAGFLFEPLWAFAVNTIGVLVELTVPYFATRISSVDLAERLSRKYPRFREFFDGTNGSEIFLVFFLRIIACLPRDAVSMYFGAVKTPYLKYLIASYIGVLPRMIAKMFIGENITNPASPTFWLSVGAAVLLSVISAALYFIHKKYREKKQN